MHISIFQSFPLLQFNYAILDPICTVNQIYVQKDLGNSKTTTKGNRERDRSC